MTSLPRVLTAAALAAGLLLAGCSSDSSTSPTGPDDTASGPAPATGEAIYDLDKIQTSIDALVAAAGTDQVTRVTVGPEQVQIFAKQDPAAESSDTAAYGVDLGGTEVGEPQIIGLPIDFATTPMTATDIDWAAILGREYPCEQPLVTAIAAGFEVRQVAAFCDPDATLYWLGEPDPITFDLTDPAFVEDALTRMTAGSSGQIDGITIVQNGTQTMPDGTNRTYSNIQVGALDGTDRVRNMTMADSGGVGSQGQEASADAGDTTFTLDELDIPGLLTCKAELMDQSGETSGSVHVGRMPGGEITYQWRDAEGALYETNTSCEQL